MRKRNFIIFIILIIAFLSFNSKDQDKITQAPNLKSTKNLFTGSRQPLVQDQVSLKMASNNTGCPLLLESLDVIDFSNDDKDWLSSFKSEDFDKCRDNRFLTKISQVKEACFKNEALKIECPTHVILLRSLIRSSQVSEAESPEELADKILSEFASENPNFKKLEELSEKLMQMNRSDVVQKLWAMSKLLSQGNPQNLPEGFADEIYSRLDPEILDDPQVRDMDMILKTGLNPSKVEDFSRELISQNATDSYAHEMLGWALWKKGNRTEAIRELELAIKFSANDQWLKQMYQNVKLPNATNKSYMGRLRLGFKLEDLF